MRFKHVTVLGTLFVALSLTACGSDNSNEGAAVSPDETPFETPQNAPPAESASSETAGNVALSTAQLDRAGLMGPTTETIVETVPCPFLSDSTAVATAETDYELLRREVSNQTCSWSENAGFSVNPIASAIPLKGRTYNLDTPPVLKGQAGPGKNAGILYDTAWDKERPYAMGFEDGDKLVEIFVTGLETAPARLSATAEEIAARLPTAQAIAHQYREIMPALDYCDIWSSESLEALVGTAPEENLRNEVYGKAGCKWDGGYGASAKSLTLARYKLGDTNLDRMVELGGQTVADLGDLAVILTRPPTDGYAGDTAMWVEIDDQQFNLTVSGTIAVHDAAAKTLMENLLSRI